MTLYLYPFSFSDQELVHYFTFHLSVLRRNKELGVRSVFNTSTHDGQWKLVSLITFIVELINLPYPFRNMLQATALILALIKKGDNWN